MNELPISALKSECSRKSLKETQKPNKQTNKNTTRRGKFVRVPEKMFFFPLWRTQSTPLKNDSRIDSGTCPQLAKLSKYQGELGKEQFVTIKKKEEKEKR